MATSVNELFEFDLRHSAFFRRAAWSVLGLGVSRAKGLVTLPLSLWILGAGGYGRVTVALAAASVIGPLALLNIADGAARLVVSAPSPDAAAANVHRIRRAGAFASTALGSVAAVLFAILGDNLVAWALLLACTWMALKIALVHFEYFQRTGKLVRIQVAVEYVTLGVGLAVAVGTGSAGFLAATAATQLVAAAFLWRAMRPPRATLGTQPPFWGAAIRLAAPLLPVSLAQWALFSADALLVYGFLGRAQAGAYSAAYSIGSIALLLPMALNSVWFPTAQRLLAAGTDELLRLFRRIGGLLLVALGAAALIGVAVQPLLRAVFHGAVYRSLPACIVWLAVGFVALAAVHLLAGVVYAAGRTTPILFAYVGGAVLNLGLNLVLIPRYGIVAAAWTTAIGYAVTCAFLVRPALGILKHGGARA